MQAEKNKIILSNKQKEKKRFKIVWLIKRIIKNNETKKDR